MKRKEDSDDKILLCGALAAIAAFVIVCIVEGYGGNAWIAATITFFLIFIDKLVISYIKEERRSSESHTSESQTNS